MRTKKLTYQIIVLNLIFSSWEWLFLFFASFYYIKLPNGGFWTATLFMTNSVVRLIASRFLARFSAQFSEEKQLFSSFLARGFLLVLILILPFIAYFPLLTLVWSLLVNVIFVYDSYATFNLKYHFIDSEAVSIAQLSSFQNLGRRGAVVVTSYLAFVLLHRGWVAISAVCSILILSGILSAHLSLVYYRNWTCRKARKADLNPDIHKEPIEESKVSNIHGRLGACFLFLTNLFFGSGSLLFAHAIEKYNLVLKWDVTILTFFYFGFVFVNILGLRFHKQIEATSSYRNLFTLCLGTAITNPLISVSASVSYVYLCALVSFFQGILYGLTLLVFSGIILKKIRGTFQNELNATIDSWGRVGFILTQLITGILLDRKIDPLNLIASYGAIAIPIFILVLMIFRKEVKHAPA